MDFGCATVVARTETLLPALLDCLGRLVGPAARRFSGDDRLLDVGLDSLRLVQLKLDVEQQLGLSLQFSQLDDNPTIA